MTPKTREEKRVMLDIQCREWKAERGSEIADHHNYLGTVPKSIASWRIVSIVGDWVTGSDGENMGTARIILDNGYVYLAHHSRQDILDALGWESVTLDIPTPTS